jgi:hypothetical protein
MEEFLAALLTAIADLLLEFLVEVFLEAFLALILRILGNLFGKGRPLNPILAGTGYLLLGSGTGALSLWLFPHPVFHAARFHGISLLISPVLTGLAMSQVGRAMRRLREQPVRIETFSFGFVFALGFAIVRLVFAR